MTASTAELDQLKQDVVEAAPNSSHHPAHPASLPNFLWGSPAAASTPPRCRSLPTCCLLNRPMRACPAEKRLRELI
jgi:hypothetical protein